MKSAARIRVLHVISGLGTGGAEMMLFKLIRALSGNDWHHHVITLRSGGRLETAIRSLGVPVASLSGIRAGIKEFNPDLIQGWMYHGNLGASLAGRLLGRSVPVVWNIRHSLYGLRHERPLTRWVIRGNAWLSAGPAGIIYNSALAKKQHEASGFAAGRAVVIPNGFDLVRFQCDPEARQRIREELGIDPAVPVIGHVARNHPMKDQAGILAAFKVLSERNSDVHLVMAGKGLEPANAALAASIAQASDVRVHLLGEREDIPDLLNAMDVFTLNSAWGEAFPNILGEAMACGVPCVTTDIGDSAFIVGDTGRVIAPRSPDGLLAAWEYLLSLDVETRNDLGVRARRRIAEAFSMDGIMRQYAELYTSLVGLSAGGTDQ